MALSRVVKCNYFKVSEKNEKCRYIPCNEAESQQNNIVKMDIMNLPTGTVSAKPVAEFKDIIDTIVATKPSVSQSDLLIYEKFVEERVTSHYRRPRLKDPGMPCNFLGLFAYIGDKFF